MPRDKRLYITVPVDIHRHPKFRRLSVDAKWAFIEMNIEAKIADNDGTFPIEEAEWLWPREVLDELVGSHPSRPVVARTTDSYVIREYGEHQETKATREERRQKNAQNGAKGGRPRKNPPETQSVTDGFDGKPNETQHKAESRVQSPEHRETTHLSESSHLPERARETDEMKEQARSVLIGLSVDPDRVVKQIRERTGREVTFTTAMRIATDILSRGDQVKNPQAFVLGSITRSWAEVQQYIDREAA